MQSERPMPVKRRRRSLRAPPLKPPFDRSWLNLPSKPRRHRTRRPASNARYRQQYGARAQRASGVGHDEYDDRLDGADDLLPRDRRFLHFLFVLVWLYWGRPARGNQNDFVVQIINIVVGALTAAFATVVNFWLGSSAGSQKKDDTNLTLQQAQADERRRKPEALQDKIAPIASGVDSNARVTCKRRPGKASRSARFGKI